MIIRTFTARLGMSKNTARAIRDVASFVVSVLFALWLWHPVATPLLLGYLYGGNELGIVHGLGHNLQQWYGTHWRRTTPLSLQVYRSMHMTHHLVEAAMHNWFDSEALAVRTKYRVTPMGVWVFIIGGHFVQLTLLWPLVALGVYFTAESPTLLAAADIAQTSALYCLLAWLGVLGFYASYEVIHWCTHRQDIPVAWLFRSRLHVTHHEHPKIDFGILPALNVGEHLPRWLIMRIVAGVALFEHVLGLVFPHVHDRMQNAAYDAEIGRDAAIARRIEMQRARAAEARGATPPPSVDEVD